MKHESSIGSLRKALLAFSVALPLLGHASASIATETLPKEVVVRGVEFVLVPAGWFFKTGGIPDGLNESGGNQRVWLDAFYIGKHEARARDLAPLLNDGDATLRALYGGDTKSCSLRTAADGGYALVEPESDLPATHLSWVLADRWARWMGFRLPTEAEWEKAARGDDRRLYPWGDDPPDETYANFNTSTRCLVWPVDRNVKGRSPYGALNMAGNVREYVADRANPEFDRALKDGARNPVSPATAEDRVILKGGRWASTPETIRISARVTTHANDPFQCNGTRFALDAAKLVELLRTGAATVPKN